MSYNAQGSPHNKTLGIHVVHSETVRVPDLASSLALGPFPTLSIHPLLGP